MSLYPKAETEKPERPSWMDNLGTPLPRHPEGYDKRLTGRPPGNPILLNPITANDPTLNPGYVNMCKPGFDPNRAIGGKTRNENRSIKRALIRLMNEPVGKQSKVRTKADNVAHLLYQLAQSKDGRNALQAIREITDRVDGRSAPSTEELDHLKEAGSNVVCIDMRLRPDESAPYVSMTSTIESNPPPQLEAPEKGNDD